MARVKVKYKCSFCNHSWSNVMLSRLPARCKKCNRYYWWGSMENYDYWLKELMKAVARYHGVDYETHRGYTPQPLQDEQ